MKHFELVRYAYRNTHTLGLIYFESKFQMYTLELPWYQNRPYVSMIPEGEYLVVKSDKKGGCWELLDVEGRSSILIHVGNHAMETQGCIMVGLGQTSNMIIHSSDALKKLNGLAEEDTQFKLTIKGI